MITDYINKINTRFRTGISTEHSFRGGLQILLESFDPTVLATNEPSRIACGAPDYIITKKDLPIGYIEAKDIGVSLKKADKSDQLKRYKSSLSNLILTDYLDFWLYRSGKFVTSAAIAEIKDKKIIPLLQHYSAFENLIREFFSYAGQTVTSARKLAEMMAGKARMMQSVIEKALTGDEQNEQDSSLKDQMTAFRRMLIHDTGPSEFADIYAQTVAYGMFAARLHDPGSEDFSRQNAAEHIPKSNPFLRNLFGYIAGPNIDDRIRWTVDALADVFRAADMPALMKNFGSAAQKNDPVIHFYETFLSAYNPRLRKSRGVWYTPEPVVNFIVRAADDILKSEFGLPAGLADTSKIQIKTEAQGTKGKVKKEVHRVQILDPAAGTGTFLAEVIRQIHQKFEGQQGIWSSYIEEHLIPRLNGFEILMASYAMAHLKLDMLLGETGCKSEKQSRLRIFLTNSLEEAHPDTATLFTTWLSNEATEANLIKRDTPVMVVLGNPPYSVSSSNKSQWIEALMQDYKRDLKERNINPLSDDYLKFIRYGQFLIEKNSEGILAYISNNSFIDGLIHRQMRKNLLETFDKIYILDLHGNVNRKEKTPEGGKDENVFDIQQGVSINLFIKKNIIKKKKLAEVYHSDVFGTRDSKYQRLRESHLSEIKWEKLFFTEPCYFWVPKDFKFEKEYIRGFKLNELFLINSSGLKTHRDHFVTDDDRERLADRIKAFYLSEKSDAELARRFHLKETGTFKIHKARNGVFDANLLTQILYRPFDTRFIYYSKELIDRPRENVSKQIILKNNFGLCLMRQYAYHTDYNYIYIAKHMPECRVFISNKGHAVFAPLYLYPQENEQQQFDNTQERMPNLDDEIVQQIAKHIGLTFTPEKEDSRYTFAPLDILDYIYAVLHSPAYRETYKEFLKTDFPRIPYPKDRQTFWRLAEIGAELRKLHLLEHPKTAQYITGYPNDGDNIVTRSITKKDFEITDKKNKTGRVWINGAQYFENVPETAWAFCIGGYQPAQKWLKDRKGRQLNFGDILHYQKIIAALNETDRIMKETDQIEFTA